MACISANVRPMKKKAVKKVARGKFAKTLVFRGSMTKANDTAAHSQQKLLKFFASRGLEAFAAKLAAILGALSTDNLNNMNADGIEAVAQQAGMGPIGLLQFKLAMTQLCMLNQP